MEFEWDAAKATSNLKKHKVAFLEAATALSVGACSWFHTPIATTESASSVPVSPIVAKGRPMKKKPEKTEKNGDELRDYYDSELIRTGVRGKYAKKFAAGTNLVLLAPDVAAVFPDAESVNEALRMLVRVARKSQAHSSSSVEQI